MGCCCLENGRSPFAALWRIEQSVGAGNPIALAWTAPTWVKLVQLTAHWSAIPVTSEFITLWKDHPGGTVFDVILSQRDPSVGAENIQNLACDNVWYFEPGEIATIDYPNTDNNNVGVEMYFQQIDK